MSRPTVSRTAKVALPALACLAVAAAASPSSAVRSESSAKNQAGESATVSWTELDPENVLRLPGNTHRGWLDVQEGGAFGGFVYGSIVDLQCEEGQSPDGHGGPDGGPDGCPVVQVRNLESRDGTLTVSGSTATFAGTIIVTNGGHGEDTAVLAQVPAKVTWTSTARLTRFRSTGSYDDRGWGITYRSRVSGLRSDSSTTVVGGALGRMGFADDVDDVSVGEFRTFTETFTERIRRR